MSPTNETASLLTTPNEKLPTSESELVQDKAHELPDKPVLIIEPSASWLAFGLRDLWFYRELFYFLIWRDVKVRYKQTVLGAAWVIIQPLVTMLIFTLFFGRLARIPSDNIPYPVFAYAGLLPWTFFANAVTNGANSIVSSSNLITKVYFPRMLIPAAAVAAGLLDFAIASLILVALMVYYGIAPTPNLIMFPVLVVLVTLLALAVGMWASALNVKYRDIRYAVPFIIQLWMFASPIIYPLSLVPPKWHWVFALNPMASIIEGFRSSLFGLGFNLKILATSTAVTLAFLVYSAHSFRRMEKSFADLV
jgi:lipopolysaccharide transport system permease protein